MKNRRDTGARLWPQGSGVRIPSLTILKSTTYIFLLNRFCVNYARTYAHNLTRSVLKVRITHDGISPIYALASVPGHLHGN
jgi:hypothetical protein